MKPGQPQTRRIIKTADEQAWDDWVRKQLSLGITPLALTAQLVKKGWQRQQAQRLVESHRDAFKPAQAVTPEPQLTELPPPLGGMGPWGWVLIVLLMMTGVGAIIWAMLR